jgi:crotonobetainyl-CoA:carnitine CoA-transferase CaiB-like acyl-CoA transferase
MSTAPLSGIRVCDVTHNLAGPFCTQILGDLGADIVKVEPLTGDPGRAWGPPFWEGESTLSLSVNRNKRSIALDLKSEAGREVLRRLAARSDVFIHSSRVGVPERLGYDYAAIRELREDVIHMSITAYGRTGPMARQPGYDPLMQAFAGLMSVTGHPDSPPTRVGGPVVDYGTGMWAAIAILAALRTRDHTGQGAQLDASLLDTTLGWVAHHLMTYFATGNSPGPMGSGLEAIAPYQAFPTSDGDVMISAGSDGIFRRLCQALGLEELARDPRFLSNPQRVAHRAELIGALEERTRGLTTEALLQRLLAHDVPASPIRNAAQVAVDAQVAAAGMLESAYPERPGYRDVALPIRIDDRRPRGSLAPPRAGQHTVEILGELGYAELDVQHLLETGAVGQASGNAWQPNEPQLPPAPL